MYDILNSVKDETTVFKRLSKTIVKYTNMNNKQIQEEIKRIDEDLNRLERQKQLIIDVYNGKDCSKLVIISEDGRTIQLSDDPSFVIEDENLKEKILAQLYFKEKGISKENFGNNVKNICDNIENDNDLSFNKSQQTVLDRKKIFSAMKVSARESGYMILNLLEECESGENIPLKAIEVKKGETIKFQDLKKIYEEFDIDYKDENWTELYVKDRKTGREISDIQLVKIAKFASVWAGVAGTKWLPNEEIRGITYAFNEQSERIYNQLGNLVSKCMTKNGMIDTQAIYEELSNDQYKHSEEIIRNLLMSEDRIGILYDFYKMQNDNAKMETKLSKTSNEFIFGVTEESLVKSGVKDIMQSIPNFNFEDERGQISAQALKRDISRSNITTSETEQAMLDLQKRQKAKVLWNRSRQEDLSQEDKALLEENERQRNQAIVDYRNMQDNKKKANGLGI